MQILVPSHPHSQIAIQYTCGETNNKHYCFRTTPQKDFGKRCKKVQETTYYGPVFVVPTRETMTNKTETELRV